MENDLVKEVLKIAVLTEAYILKDVSKEIREPMSSCCYDTLGKTLTLKEGNYNAGL